MVSFSYHSTLWVAIVASIALNCAVGTVASEKDQGCELDSLRLPGRIKPSHYELSLQLDDSDRSKRTFEGQVKINITVGEQDENCPPKSVWDHLSKKSEKLPFGCDDKEIILNANKQVAINGVEVLVEKKGKPGSLGNVKIEDQICQDLASEMVSIRLKKGLPQGSRGQIIINFELTIGPTNIGHGLFESEPSSDEAPMFVTHFEAAHARSTFPCFDEPEFKSTFDVIIKHRKELTALSNTLPIARQQVVGKHELVETRFERTPPMSTYLLAISVGQFDHLETKTLDDDLLLRVFVPVDQKEKGRWALETARRSYEALHEYFGIDQPLKKIDLLAANIGVEVAMENWGLVTIAKKQVLVEPNTSSLELSGDAVTIARELAHHWFGHLVTMRWWDDLWLNKAFAQLMGYTIIDKIHPEFDIEIQLVQVLMSGLKADSQLDVSHPIKEPNLKTIKDIEATFDRITYDKGVAVLRMIERYMGHEAFKLGIRDYIEEFKFTNTDEHDLWRALDARARDDSPILVSSMMMTWLYQAGFPLLKVELTKNNRKVRVTQQQFQRDFSKHEDPLWIIPVNMLVVGQDGTFKEMSRSVKRVLSEKSQEISLPDWFDVSKGHWIKLNAGAEGFFRVQYSPELMSLMEQPIRSKQMSVIDRMNFLDDMRALWVTPHRWVEYSAVELILSWFEAEDNASVIHTLAQLVETIRLWAPKSDTHLMLVDYYKKMQGYKCDPGEGMQEQMARNKVLVELIKGKFELAIEEGLNLLSSGKLIHSSCKWPGVVEALEEHNISSR